MNGEFKYRESKNEIYSYLCTYLSVRACVCFIIKSEKQNVISILMPINIYKYLRLRFAAQQEVASRPVMRRGSSVHLKKAVKKLKYDSFQMIKNKSKIQGKI